MDAAEVFVELYSISLAIFVLVASGRFLIAVPTYLKRIAEALEGKTTTE